MSSPFSALLLAGGKSSRMGTDKAWIEIDGVPLWRRQLGLLESLGPAELFLAGNISYAGCITIPDAQPNVGPLGALVTAFRRATTARVLVLAVDMPNMTYQYLRALLNEPAVPRGQVLAAVYPTAARAIAEDQLRAGRYSVHEFAARCVDEGLARFVDIAEEERPLFANMNTPEDLLALTHA